MEYFYKLIHKNIYDIISTESLCDNTKNSYFLSKIMLNCNPKLFKSKDLIFVFIKNGKYCDIIIFIAE